MRSPELGWEAFMPFLQQKLARLEDPDLCSIVLKHLLVWIRLGESDETKTDETKTDETKTDDPTAALEKCSRKHGAASILSPILHSAQFLDRHGMSFPCERACQLKRPLAP
jgi:hypothetical protein